MDDEGTHPDRTHQHNIGGEISQRRPVAQRVAAVLDHHDLVPETSYIRQRFDQDLGLGPGVEAGHYVARAHGANPATGSPVVSGQPITALAHWTACPAAPLTRLSRAQMVITHPVLSSKRAVRWAALDPRVALVEGLRSETTTNGSPA